MNEGVIPDASPSPSSLERLGDARALTDRAAELVIAAATSAIDATGRFTLALSGGSTPRALYSRLAEPAQATRMDWGRVHLFWGDERCVPPTDGSSNYRMADEALLSKVPVPPANVHRIRGEDEPRAAANGYETLLRSWFAGTTFDLVLLGMGSNGHTASLFPGLTAVDEAERWVAAELVPEVGMWRVTLTAPAINAAARVLFLVTGRDKAATLREVLSGPRDPRRLPAQLISPSPGRLTWLVDEAAAAELGGADSR
jgi:6-phosphogluconolactonase